MGLSLSALGPYSQPVAPSAPRSGKRHCSVTAGLLLLLPAVAWLGLEEPPRLMGCGSPGHLAVRARPPEGCMARMGCCTTPAQVKVQKVEKMSGEDVDQNFNCSGG